MKTQILCIGEILWDSLPGGLFLGGAPFNVACHLKQLGQNVLFASRVGNDKLGKAAIFKAARKGLATDLIQIDDRYSTGIVNVNLERKDSPVYTIESPAAWDFIEMNPALEKIVYQVDMLVYGSLAQRQPKTRQTIEKLRQHSRLIVFDINLRPPFDDRDIVLPSLKNAHIVKMNDTEFRQLTEWFQLSTDLKTGMADIAQKFNSQTVCVTSGEKGSALLHNGNWVRKNSPVVTVKDTVGAGDAFLAALLSGILEKRENDEILSFANALGAYIATQNGATASIDLSRVKALQK